MVRRVVMAASRNSNALGARVRGSVRTRVSVALWLAISLVCGSTQAQPRELLRYEPPPVDAIYPVQGDEPTSPQTPEAPNATPLDAGPPSAPTNADAGVSPIVTPPDAALDPTSVAASVVPQGPAAPPIEYGARAEVKQPPPRGSHKLSLQATRDVPGSFGDPLRVLDSLPGVVPLTSGLPYVYIRGAPPAGQGYYYDNIPLPQLFHAAFGPAILHPRTTGSVQLWAGVPDATYGRRVGGALVANGVPQGDSFAAELEMRLIDMGGWLETPVGKGMLTVSGRIGYAEPLLRAAQAANIVDDGVSINYTDGQLRFKHPLSNRDAFELVYLGSFDNVNLPGLSNDPRAGASRLQFHRVEPRLIHKIGRHELGSALRFGYDESAIGSALHVVAYTFGPRIWGNFRLGRHTLRATADLYGSKGDVDNRGGVVASPDGDLRVSLPTIAQAAARNQGGVALQGSFLLGDDTRLDLGARVDYWSVQSKITLAFDPRLRLTHDITEALSVHTAVGMTHQPAVFILPTPGLTDVALDRGLMSSTHSELGAEYAITDSTSIEVQGYLHHYENLLLLELIRDGDIPEDLPLVSSNAYGIETFLKRDLSEKLAGWVSYTLGWASADSGRVVGRFKPDYDVRHVINTVLNYRIWRGLTMGMRMQVRSGRVVEQLNPRYTQRLPWFARLDARVGYSWPGRFAKMTAYLEWFNVTARREYSDIDCLLGVCRARPAPLITLPNLGVRAEF